MQQSIDFLDRKVIIRYMVIFAIVLMGGVILKDIFPVLLSAIIIIYILSRRLFESVEVWLIWFFCYGFYSGQGLMTSDLVSKYLSKPSFLLVLIFISCYNLIPSKVRATKYLALWMGFLGVSLLSLVFHGKPLFVLITVSSFFIIYLITRSDSLSKLHCKKLLNLFLAVALFQTVICLLQIAQLIPPPSRIMDDGSGGQFEWIAGLDDVASGTFGPATAHLVSWYASMIALFCFLVWTRVRKADYLIVAIIALGQFATVDSKTIMGVMLVMMLYLFYYISKNRALFNLTFGKIFKIVLFATMVGYILFTCWNFYYQYQNAAGGVASRGDIKDVYTNEIQTSRDLVMANLGDWGKIQGFHYVFNDFVKENSIEILLGYSLVGYSFNGKMGYIERKDTPIMQLNNITRSRSSLITHFAQSGIAGFALLLISIFAWYRFNAKRNHLNEIDVITNSMLKIFLPFAFLAAFIYDVSFSTIPTISFAAIIGILKRYSDLPREIKVNIRRSQVAEMALC